MQQSISQNFICGRHAIAKLSENIRQVPDRNGLNNVDTIHTKGKYTTDGLRTPPGYDVYSRRA